MIENSRIAWTKFQGVEFKVNFVVEEFCSNHLTPSAQCGLASFVQRLTDSDDVNGFPQLYKLIMYHETYEWLLTPFLAAKHWTALLTEIQIYCAKLWMPLDLSHCTELKIIRLHSELSWSPDDIRSFLTSLKDSPVKEIDMGGSTVSPEVYSYIWQWLPERVMNVTLAKIEEV